MKKIVISIALLFYLQTINVFAVIPDIYPFSPNFVVLGEVLEIGESKNSVYPFRLVRYKVNKVCKGEYKEREISVYNILEPVTDIVLKIGDERVLPITKSEGLFERADKLYDDRWASEYFVMEYLVVPDCKS